MNFPPISRSFCEEMIHIVETEILNFSVFRVANQPQVRWCNAASLQPSLPRVDSKMGQRSSTETVWGNATPTITKAHGTCNIKILLS